MLESSKTSGSQISHPFSCQPSGAYRWSLLFLQLILAAIKNGSKTCRVLQLAVLHVWHGVLFTDEHTALTLWQWGASLTSPPTSAPLGAAPQGCWGQDGSPNQLGGLPCTPTFHPCPSSLPPTSWAPAAAPAPSLVRAVTHAPSPHLLQMQSGRLDKPSV